MRKILNEQMKMGQIDIGNIEIDVDCRDEIPQILLGLQHIYRTPELFKEISKILRSMIPPNISHKDGRSGMDLWKILVLGTLRLCCNWDYDKLQNIADNHKTLRGILGHGPWDWEQRYPRQTICDNIHWFTEEILDKINQVVVRAGQNEARSQPDAPIGARCDSFVVETDVHYPTDINLLWDAVRKAIALCSKLSSAAEMNGWRQANHLKKKIKRLLRRVQKERHKNKQSNSCLHWTSQYIIESEAILRRAETLLSERLPVSVATLAAIEQLRWFVQCGFRQIEQISRRVMNNETIPHCEKIFSLFEPHTEWISKGKAGTPQELGLRVCVVQSLQGFILHHRVMEKVTDDAVAVPIVRETQKRFPSLISCSFDKGFHSPDNQKQLKKLLPLLVLPKKGKLNETERQDEQSEWFSDLRCAHSAVESAINGLECCGLDRCRDFGIDGFRRYVALSVVARNLQLLGGIIQRKRLEALHESRKSAKKRNTAA